MSQHGCPERLSNRTKGFQEEGGSEPTMEVLVETLTGTAFEMTVSPSDTIFAIKSKIFRVEGIPIGQQHLLYNLKELEDGSSLSELAIGDGARLRLVLGMRGGPISTRRLPQPAPAHQDFWPARIERLLDSNRDEGEWSGAGAGAGGGAGAGAGCKVTVLVFRDGERVNMLRVKENTDGTYSPIEHAKYSSTASGTSASGTGGGGAGAGAGGGAGVAAARAVVTPPLGADNVLTHAKMADLRRRMDTLSLLKHNRKHTSTSNSMQKTRSEETLYGGGRGGGGGRGAGGGGWRRYGDDGAVTPLADGNFTRYEYDCSFADRYTLLPPIGPRGGPAQSVGAGGGGGSVSSLRGAADAAAAPPAARPGGYALLSSSTSDLHSTHRVLPALSRHRNRSQLHLPDEPGAGGAAGAAEPAGGGPGAAGSKARRERCCRCRKRLGAATLLRCRCGAAVCAEHRYPDTHACALLQHADRL